MAGKYLRKKKKKKPQVMLWLIPLLILLTAGGVGTAVAKYVRSSAGRILTKAPEFYFTSDLLGEERQDYVLNSTVDHVTFVLRDRADELRASQVSVSYEIKTSGGTLSTSSGTFEDGDVAVTLSNMQPGVIYEVEATGSAGYTKTLKARFRVSDQDENVYRNLEVSPDGFMILTVWTHNVAGTLSVSFPAELIPDNTNPYMGSVFNRDNAANNTFTAGLAEYSSHTFRFFCNGGTYQAEQFSVSVTDEVHTFPAVTEDLP